MSWQQIKNKTKVLCYKYTLSIYIENKYFQTNSKLMSTPTKNEARRTEKQKLKHNCAAKKNLLKF